MSPKTPLKQLMEQGASYFEGFTPNWPKGQDATRFDSITIYVKIKWSTDASRPGLNRKQADALCRRIHCCIQRNSPHRIVSVQI